MEIPEPSANTRMATTKLQKYTSFPCPKGNLSSAGFLDCFKPCNNNSWLPVSTSEWIPSDSMAELPVKAAAMNLVIAISVLPANAANMTFVEEPDIVVVVLSKTIKVL